MLNAIRLTSDPAPLGAASPEERRANERQRHELDLELELELDHHSHFFTGLSQDISEGGVFVATYDAVPVGHRLRLTIELPDGTCLSASGEVRWVRVASFHEPRPGIGVAFTELSDEARMRIVRLCEVWPPLYVEC